MDSILVQLYLAWDDAITAQPPSIASQILSTDLLSFCYFKAGYVVTVCEENIWIVNRHTEWLYWSVTVHRPVSCAGTECCYSPMQPQLNSSCERESTWLAQPPLQPAPPSQTFRSLIFRMQPYFDPTK